MTAKLMTKIPRGLGLVYYFQHRSFILAQLEQGYPVTQIYRDLQAQPSNSLLPSYRQLFKLINANDKGATRHVSYHKDRATQYAGQRSSANKSIGNTPKIETGMSSLPREPKKCDALKPEKFTYNPHYNEKDL